MTAPRPPRPAEPPDLSRRDLDLARIDILLANPPEPAGGTDGAGTTGFDAADLIDPGALAEASPPARPAVSRRKARTEPARRLDFFRPVLQTVIIFLLLIWVFILGVLIGRSHLTETGWGQEFMTWLEKKAGWEERPRPVAVEAAPETADSPAAGGGPALVSFYNSDEPWYHEPWGPESVRPEPLAPEAGEDGGLAEPGPITYMPAYAIQTDLVYDEEEAGRRAKKLEELGFPAYFYKNPQTGRFPVRVGRFQTREEAEKTLKTLKLLGYREAYISELPSDSSPDPAGSE